MTNNLSSKNSSDKKSSAQNKELPSSLKGHLRKTVENELFSRQNHFFKCANHLHEFKWLTETEIDGQHEFYPYHENFIEKLAKIFKRKPKIKIPESEEVADYIKYLREEISSEIENRLQKEKDLKKDALEKWKAMASEKREKEESASFYRSHPDYKLYENHLGETRWLTQEEYECQDEFTDEVISSGKKIIYAFKWILPTLIIFLIIGYFLKPDSFNSIQKGYLLFEANEAHGQLYINEKLKLGVTINEPFNLSPGTYHITYRKPGFESTPTFYQIEINNKDTTKIQFLLQPKKVAENGVIKLHSPYADAKVFVDKNFYGTAKNNSKLILAPGNYRISLTKENYATVPPFVNLTVDKNDSINLSFKFVPRSTIRTQPASNGQGLIEITSNISGSQIYIDGKYSGFETDYIFYKIPFGKHTISVKKDGYSVQPEEKIVQLSHQNSSQSIHFTLKKTDLEVTLRTDPVKGKIFLDGKEIASGSWKGGLPPGKYQLHFGPVDFYRTPSSETIQVGEQLPKIFTFTYEPIFTLIFSPSGISPRDDYGGIQIGYMDGNHVFHSDPINAPEIIQSDKLNKKTWILGYAFAYRNPPENDAILFTFNIPSTIDLKNNMWLKMWGYRTEEKYPLEFTSVSEIRISVNNRVIQDEYTPTYTINKADESKFERFRINNLVRHGKNRLIISTTPVNTTYFALWKIAIE